MRFQLSAVATALLLTTLSPRITSAGPFTVRAQPMLDSSHSYYSVRPDYRKCMWPMCGGYWIKLANRSATECANGAVQSECYVVNLLLDPANLSDEQKRTIHSAPEAFLLRAYVRPAKVEGAALHGYVSLIVTEAWQALTDDPPTGRLVRLTDSGLACAGLPCPSMLASLLTRYHQFLLDEVNFSGVGSTEDDREAVRNAIYSSPDGVLAAGERYWARSRTWFSWGFAANQLYRRLER